MAKTLAKQVTFKSNKIPHQNASPRGRAVSQV